MQFSFSNSTILHRSSYFSFSLPLSPCHHWCRSWARSCICFRSILDQCSLSSTFDTLSPSPSTLQAAPPLYLPRWPHWRTPKSVTTTSKLSIVIILALMGCETGEEHAWRRSRDGGEWGKAVGKKGTSRGRIGILWSIWKKKLNIQNKKVNYFYKIATLVIFFFRKKA